MLKKVNYKKLVAFIVITILIGSFFSLFINVSTSYNSLIKPSLSPPGYIFPIVWIILYILMAISLYLVTKSNQDINIYKLYFYQLLANSLWTVFFFGFGLRLLSFLWIILIIILNILLLKEYYKTNKLAVYLQIPYLIWLLFASYLNLAIYILNR